MLIPTHFLHLNAMDEKKAEAVAFALEDVIVPQTVKFLHDRLLIEFPHPLQKQDDSYVLKGFLLLEGETIGQTKFVFQKNALGINVAWRIMPVIGNDIWGNFLIDSDNPAYHPGRLITRSSFYLIGAYLDQKLCKDDLDRECPICLRTFIEKDPESGQNIILERCYLSCALQSDALHILHAKCFRELITFKAGLNVRCPCCRTPISKAHDYIILPQTPLPEKE
jgi:hypothetical protein